MCGIRATRVVLQNRLALSWGQINADPDAMNISDSVPFQDTSGSQGNFVFNAMNISGNGLGQDISLDAFAAPTYFPGENVEYLSISRDCIWIPARVKAATSNGTYILQLRSQTWDAPAEFDSPAEKIRKSGDDTMYSVGESVEYLSISKGCVWISAKVVEVEEGYTLDIGDALQRSDVPVAYIRKVHSGAVRAFPVDPCKNQAPLDFKCYEKVHDESMHLWDLSYRLGGGTFGSVFKAMSRTGVQGALKTAAGNPDHSVRQSNCKSIHDEVHAIDDIKAKLILKGTWADLCETLMMPYLDAKPCILEPHPDKKGQQRAVPLMASFVMKQMSGDLHSYMEGATTADLDRCMPDVVRKVRQALICLHSVDLAHMDVKAGNILVKYDAGHCPEEVRLSDFGETRAIGSLAGYKTGLMEAWYMPEEMFENASAGRIGNFSVEAKYDWCMFLLLFEDIPQAYPDSQWDDGWEGDCGMMGFNRETHIVLRYR